MDERRVQAQAEENTGDDGAKTTGGDGGNWLQRLRLKMGKKRAQRQSDASATSDEAEEARGHGKKWLKWLWIGGAAVVVIAGAAAGGLWWHEKPSFCATLCHSTMSPYYASYQSKDMLVAKHAKLGIRCIDCHHATIGDQFTELTAQLGGSVKSPLDQREFPNTFCSGKRCHGKATLQEAALLTGMLTPNPHDNKVFTVSKCSACHKMHSTKGMAWSPTSDCSECHPNQASAFGDSKMLASKHKDQKCTDCHTDEARLAEIHAKGGTSTEEVTVSKDVCLKCHGPYTTLAEKTKDSIALKDTAGTVVNPHDTPKNSGHAADMDDCRNCHAIHKVPKGAAAYCYNCHHTGKFECGGCHK